MCIPKLEVGRKKLTDKETKKTVFPADMRKGSVSE